MTSRSDTSSQNEIDALITQLGSEEPPMSSLGAPLLADTETTRRLVAMGPAVVPSLIAALDREPRIARYAAYCLGQLQDATAVPALLRARERYQAREPKGPYDVSVIASINHALDQLSPAPAAD